MEWIFQDFVDIQTEWIFPTFKKTLAQTQLLPTQQYLDLLIINPPKNNSLRSLERYIGK